MMSAFSVPKFKELVDRAYPQSGIFKFCAPDVPCITPGTYAFLGAAAALRCVTMLSYYHASRALTSSFLVG